MSRPSKQAGNDTGVAQWRGARRFIQFNGRKKTQKLRGTFCLRNRIKLVQGGKEFFDTLKEVIDSAKHNIHFQTYIFGEDQTGNEIADALMAAARRNVKVYLLLDGFASQHLSQSFRHKLKEAGVHFRYFEPLFRSTQFYLGRRLHHKVVVVDGYKSLVGSMNIADRYNDVPPSKAWFDVALYAEGDIAAELYQVCCKIWYKRSKKCELPEGASEHIDEIPENEYTPARVRRNDWMNREDAATPTYYELIRSAHHSVYIVCSYFIPGKKLMALLRSASRRGVRIRIVLAGSTDILTAKFAERYLYRWMLRYNIEVYEYQPTVLHAKLAVADDHWLTLGSYNVNGLSAYASVELNLDVKKDEFAKEMRMKIDKMIKEDCTPADPKVYKSIFRFKQLLQWGAFQIIRLMVKIATFHSRAKG